MSWSLPRLRLPLTLNVLQLGRHRPTNVRYMHTRIKKELYVILIILRVFPFYI